MTQPRKRTLKIHCRIKTRHENVFDTREEAEVDARACHEEDGGDYQAYRCRHCGKYHSGTRSGRKFRKGYG